MNYSTYEDTLEQVKLPVEINALTAYRAREQVRDVLHKLDVVLPLEDLYWLLSTSVLHK